MSTMWEPKQPSIGDLLKDIHGGKLALPQFQRQPVWSPKRNEIPFLTAIVLGRPTGSLLTFGYTDEPKQFPVHAIEGAPVTDQEKAQQLILDGQQRLTTVYRAFHCGWAENHDGKAAVKRMILDVAKALKRGALDEEDFSLEAGADAEVAAMARTGRVDLRTLAEKDNLDSWYREYVRHAGEGSPEKEDVESQKLGNVIPHFREVLHYRFPVMEVKQETEVGVVAEIFEHMNSRGQPLNRFDLMVARMYQLVNGDHDPTDYYNLREEWLSLLEKSPNLQRIGVDEDDGLMPLQLIAWQKLKKVTTTAVLQLPPESVIGNGGAGVQLGLESAMQAFESAAEFVVTRCGVAAPRLLPQKAMLLPIANQHLRHLLKGLPILEPEKLKLWFFASCLLEAPRYYGGVNSRVAEDCGQLEAWVDNGLEPDFVRMFKAGNIKDLKLDIPMTREGNIKGLAVMALLVHGGAKDWSSDQPQVKDAETIHLHHMVPNERLKTWWPGTGWEHQKRQNIANFTPISAKINQKHGADSPERVLDSLAKHAKPILDTHGVKDTSLRAAFRDEESFDSFCKERAEQLKVIIRGELGLG